MKFYYKAVRGDHGSLVISKGPLRLIYKPFRSVRAINHHGPMVFKTKNQAMRALKCENGGNGRVLLCICFKELPLPKLMDMGFLEVNNLEIIKSHSEWLQEDDQFCSFPPGTHSFQVVIPLVEVYRHLKGWSMAWSPT